MGRYVVVDLEMCRVPKRLRSKKYRWGMETIQIGAVLLDDTMEVADRFMTYVAPQFGFIDDYIEDLTGIKTKNLTEAPSMEEAMEQFVEWVPKDATLVAWSNSDALQFRHEMQGKDIVNERMEALLENWVDCQQVFGERLHTARIYRLSEALVMADIDFDEKIHDGLVDAYNTALLYAKMEKEPELRLNSYYERIGEVAEGLCISLAGMFSGIVLPECA